MQKQFPLVTRNPDDIIAYLTRPISGANLPAGKINSRQFLSHVKQVADRLEVGHHAINLCENRYLFLVGFCAAIVRGHVNLLPPNKNIATQRNLHLEYAGCYIIHDGSDVAEDMPNIDIAAAPLDMGDNENIETPLINIDQLSCISFTSGSTGNSKPNLKYWHTLYRSSEINYEFMVPDSQDTLYQLATMPAQHMWGLETSVLLAMFSNVCLSDAKPLFPQDIIDTLNALPAPRMLVSTPVHLRALCATERQSQPVHSVLCATSPLPVELAKNVEKQFNAPLREVYGCSEVGSMAVRRTAEDKNWRRFEGIEFERENEATVVRADHLPTPTILQDVIVHVDSNHFTLAGRASDLVKIAGKRGSLFDINQILLGFKGLKDGTVIYPESDNAVTRLVAIVSLEDGVEKSDLIRYFQSHLDSAFVPRPVYVVDSLPRESNGKLLRKNIDTLHASLRKSKLTD